MIAATDTDACPPGPGAIRSAAVADQGGLLVHGRVGAPPSKTAGSKQAGLALTPEEVAYLIGTAARAPSVHNTQPWRFRVRGDVIELLADSDRQLRHLDAAGRELMISCGAALFGLRLGFRKLGYLPVVELLPEPAQPLLVARVRPDGRAAATRAESELVAAVPHRHTHRGPFAPGEVSVRLLTELRADATAERADLVLIEDPRLVCKLGELVELAASEQRADPHISAELSRWVRPADSEARDGIPASARIGQDRGSTLGQASEPQSRARRPRSAESSAAPLAPRLPQRDFGSPGTERDDGAQPAATAVLATQGDSGLDWIRAGQALDRLLLRAATRWVFASLQSQPLESPLHRDHVRRLLGLTVYPQMLVQFGRANIAPATPRRPQAELMAND